MNDTIDINDHEIHRKYLYYPSNRIVIGSDDEYRLYGHITLLPLYYYTIFYYAYFRYFTKIWPKNINYKHVKQIYDYFDKECPCKYIIAFNICRLEYYNGMTNLMFNNMFMLKSSHFTHRITTNVERENLNIIFNNCDIISKEHYDLLCTKLPASSQVCIINNCVMMRVLY